MLYYFLILTLSAPNLHSAYTDFGSDFIADVGTPLTNVNTVLTNPFTRTETTMRYSWIYNCVFSDLKETAITFNKNTEFKVKIGYSTIVRCTSTTNPGALLVSAPLAGQLWLEFLCISTCTSSSGAGFANIDIFNTSIHLVTAAHCTSTTGTLTLTVSEKLFVENFNSSKNSAPTAPSISLTNKEAATLQFISFQEDEATTEYTVLFPATFNVKFYYSNFLDLKAGKSIVEITNGDSATAILTFDHVYFGTLTFTEQVFHVSAATSAHEIQLISCTFKDTIDTSSIATSSASISTTIEGAPPIESYLIRQLGTKECQVEFPYPTKTPTPSRSPIYYYPQPVQPSTTTTDSGWKWWYCLLLTILILLIIFLIWYLCLLFCPVFSCCACCPCCLRVCPCCDCLCGRGRCECASCVCDGRCGHCKCCKKRTQCENYDEVNLESDVGAKHRRDSSDSSDEDTDKILQKYAPTRGTADSAAHVATTNTSGKKAPKRVIHYRHAIAQLARDKQKLTSELNEKDNIITRQMQEMDQMESDLDNDGADVSADQELDKKQLENINSKKVRSDDSDDEDSVHPLLSEDGSSMKLNKDTKNLKYQRSQSEHLLLVPTDSVGGPSGFGGSRSRLQSRQTPFGTRGGSRRTIPGTDIFSFAMNNQVNDMQSLIKRDPTIVNKRNRLGCTPLYIAAQRGNLQLCKLLIDNGADLNLPNKYGHSPLHRAACNGHLNVCKLLVSKGCQLDSRTNWGFTPLDRAVQKNKPAVVQYLISQGSSLTAKDNFGNTPFHRAAKHGRTDMISMFMTAGAEVNIRGCDGMTALHYAAEGNFVKTAQMLISYNADPKIKSNDGRLPIDMTSTDSMFKYLQQFK